MTKRNGVLRVESRPDPKLLGENINEWLPGFFTKGKAFLSTIEGNNEFVEWLRSIPEDSVLAKYKAELPEAEAKLKEMEVA